MKTITLLIDENFTLASALEIAALIARTKQRNLGAELARALNFAPTHSNICACRTSANSPTNCAVVIEYPLDYNG